MVVNGLAILQQMIQIFWIETNYRNNKTIDLIKSALLLNLHSNELGDVVMPSVSNLEENVRRTLIFHFPKKIYKTAIKIRKPYYNTPRTQYCPQ